MKTVEKLQENGINETRIDEKQLIEQQFSSVPVEELYKLAVKFYRDKEKSGEIIVSYDDRLRFMAFAKQARYGPYNAQNDDSGWFDFVGSDRTKAWKELGDLSASSAMSAFVSLLDTVCPPFRDFVEEHVQSSRKLTQEREEEVVTRVEDSSSVPSPQDVERFESQRRQIQEALNQQTYHQFRAYAQQQFIGDPVQVILKS
ncbi:hypothetical protein AB6A40_002266 [Gnathostoma spinigerum]|uniref:ACB domain-containing protein n=1 Tax=Gnathostoma spinigerum TaxID=75299 RepID=A0ABD6EFU9_9BILA